MKGSAEAPHKMPAGSAPQESARLLAEAVKHHQSGNLSNAEVLYQRILQAKPDHADALHLLGVIAYQRGKNEVAAAHIRKAISLNPNAPYYHNNLGSALQCLGQIEDALKCCREALRLKPDCAEAYNNIGNVMGTQGNLDEAIMNYQKAISLKKDFVEAYNNIANALKKKERFEEAIEYYRKAIQLRPGFVEAYFNLGNALKDNNKLDEAICNYRKVIEIKPDFADAYNNLGNALKDQNRPDEALTSYQKAIELKPEFAEAYNNIGNILRDKDVLAEAIEYYDKALQLKPDFTWAYINTGNTLMAQGKPGESLAYYDKALQLEPDLADAHYNKALPLLLMGMFEEGWCEYEWRFRSKEISERIGYQDIGKPRWDGSSLQGKTILIRSEQGYGDTIQYIRYVPLVKARGGRVVFECHRDLLGLLKTFPGIDSLVDDVASVPFDSFISLLSLPGLFNTTLDTIFADVPYLMPDPGLAMEWKAQIGDESFKIGLVWAGNAAHRNDRNRSCSLSDFAPLGSIPGITFFSLQKGPACAQLENPPDGMSIINLGEKLKDFSHTAAAIANLDLVISVDTAIVHLAGAMGKPVWTLLPIAPDWRWLMDRADTPWYPTMKLFRQKQPGDWKSVMEHIAQEISTGAGI